MVQNKTTRKGTVRAEGDFLASRCVLPTGLRGLLEVSSILGSRKGLWPFMPGGWGHGSSLQPILDQFPAELEKTTTGGEGGNVPGKKIIGSNKSSCNGLKNEMLPKQVQLEVCVQKPYGQWECVGVLIRGAERPALPGCRSMASRGTQLGGASVGGVCMAVHVCVHVSAWQRVHVCACLCVHGCALLQAAACGML